MTPCARRIDFTFRAEQAETPWAVFCVPSAHDEREFAARLLFPTMVSDYWRERVIEAITRHATRTDAEAAIRRDETRRGVTGRVLVQVSAGVPTQ